MVSIKNKIKMSFSKKLPEKLIINFAWPKFVEIVNCLWLGLWGLGS